MPRPDSTHLQHALDAEGMTLTLIREGKPVPLKQWSAHYPTAGAALSHVPHDPSAVALMLPHSQLASITDFTAVALHLPRQMEAWMSVAVAGRIDSDDFRVTLTLEPLQHAHAWVVYRRTGAVIEVGQRALRLNPSQLRLFEALDAMQAAGRDVAARLEAWTALSAALNTPHQALIRVVGSLPRIQLARVAKFPEQTRLRRAGRLVPATPADGWAMGPKHRYYLRAS